MKLVGRTLRQMLLSLAAAALALQPAFGLCQCPQCDHGVSVSSKAPERHACCHGCTGEADATGCACVNATAGDGGCNCCQPSPQIVAASTDHRVDRHDAVVPVAVVASSTPAPAGAPAVRWSLDRRGPSGVPLELRPHAFFSVWLN